ncbi:hypothetical protein N9043_01075 [bacterium]|nr:hypothetical protein [bacterium]
MFNICEWLFGKETPVIYENNTGRCLILNKPRLLELEYIVLADIAGTYGITFDIDYTDKESLIELLLQASDREN